MANEPNYSSNPSKDEPKKEKVRVIPLEYIDEFPGHPFKVLDDESMQKLMNSIEEIGVQSPIVARIKEDQRYEIISGHRRVHACRRLGLKLIPAIVRDLSRDEAIIAMVDANLQREHILPSEKAAAYKMKMEAMKRRAGRPSKNNSTPMAGKLERGTLISCQDDSQLIGTLYPVVEKLTDMRIVNAELKVMISENKREYYIMALMVVANIPLLYLCKRNQCGYQEPPDLL